MALTIAALMAVGFGPGVGRAAAAFGVEPGTFKTETSSTQAAGHPDVTTSFSVNRLDPGNPISQPDGSIRDIDLDLPPGLVADPTVAPVCTVRQVRFRTPPCPRESAVGTVEFELFDPVNPTSPIGGLTRLYRVDAEGDEAAAFAFTALIFPVRISATVGPEGGYRVRTKITNLNETMRLMRTKVTLWGQPSEHQGPGPLNDFGQEYGGPLGGASLRPFVTAPSPCDGRPLTTLLSVASWQTRELVGPLTSSAPAGTGCDRLRFNPTVAVQPQTSAASSPSGLDVNISVPQSLLGDAVATPDLRDAVVALPEGLVISPAAADGLQACSDVELAIDSNATETCPSASKIGSATIVTPLLEAPLEGAVYIGSQLSNDPQSGEMFRLFLTAGAPGVTIKLIGAVSADPNTGRLVTTFANNPQLPFSNLHLFLEGGPRAPLSSPTTCGDKTTRSELTSRANPYEPVGSDSSFPINQNCQAASQFTPSLEAGVASPVGGGSSTFTLNLTRPNGQQNIEKLSVVLPEGQLAKLVGVPVCPDAEAASGTCPAASQVGTTTVAAGPGSNPIYVPQPGKPPTAVYLAGPYKGAPYSLVVKVPAQAGPFDLGTVVVRNALEINPVTTQVTTVSDPLPQILGGIPISYRTVGVAIDRPGFIQNPTNCEPTQITSTITSAQGTIARPSNPYQLGDCERLGFKPKLALKLSGRKTRRGGYPRLRATLTTKKGDANIGRVAVTLPKTEYLEQAHIRTICTRVQYAAHTCPAKSVYGYAKAWTPLLDKPLEGPVYLRSSNHKLPDLVGSLDGQIHVDLDGRIDSVRSRIRNTFDFVPDAPVSKFVLTMKGGSKSLLVNNTELCKAKPQALVKFSGQNGKAETTNPLAKVSGCGKKGKKAKKGKK